MCTRDLILKTAGDRFILFPDTVLKSMNTFVQNDPNSTEAGGILIGSYRGNDIIVSSNTTPMKFDRRKRFLFDRRDRGHQKIAMNAWQLSNKTETYIGEWHTHPEDHPTPSYVDLNTWTNVLKKDKETKIFYIVGIKSSWIGIGSEKNITSLQLHNRNPLIINRV